MTIKWKRELDSPVGTLTIVASDEGVREIRFPDESADEAEENGEHPVLEQTAAQLSEYFEGHRRQFDLPLDLEGTEFQVTAWRALADIPYGSTTTYSEQAAAIGRPSAVRAIGAANGRNPIPIVLPCHRVIGADGSLTGYAGGLDIKRFLLEHES